MPLTLRRDTTVDLTADEVDDNFEYLDGRIDGIADTIPAPVSLSGVVNQVGFTLTFGLTDATFTNSVTIPPFQANFRDEWEPLTAYFVNDLVRIRGFGYFLVVETHTSEAEFNTGDDNYAFQYVDQTVQLPLVIGDTTEELTITRADHLNRLLLFMGTCDCTMDPDDWEDGDQVHLMNRSGGVVTVTGVSDLAVDPGDDSEASITARGATATLVYLADEDVMAMFGKLDAVSA